MAEFREFYSAAEYYDIVFDRDVSPEVDFVLDLYRMVNGADAKSALEVACGPGYHALELARRGVSAHGLDLEADMISRAAEKASENNLSINYFVADMRRFDIPSKVDVAISMLDGIDSLFDIDELIEHFQCVSACLTNGGIYILDNMHPRDVNLYNYPPVIYRGQRDDVEVKVTYGVDAPTIDLEQQTAVALTRVEIQNGEHSQQFESTAKERFITVQELRALMKSVDGLEYYGAWGAFDLDVPFSMSEKAERMILVVRKELERRR